MKASYGTTLLLLFSCDFIATLTFKSNSIQCLCLEDCRKIQEELLKVFCKTDMKVRLLLTSTFTLYLELTPPTLHVPSAVLVHIECLVSRDATNVDEGYDEY